MKTPIRKTIPLALTLAVGTLYLLVIPMAGAAVWLTNSPMNIPRDSHTATVLTNGKVLIIGGRNNGVSPVLTNAELFDPVTQLFSNTAVLAVARESHTATLLPNGKVLVAGGMAAGGVITNSAELYDAATGTWTPTGLMKTRRLGHTATLLPDGKVLVAAGLAAIGGLIILTNSAELYDPASGTWTFTNAMSVKRYNHTATLLADGRVLIAGGDNGVNSLASVELFNPTNGTWTPSIMPMSSPRFSHTATLLLDGRVLLAGGFGASGITNTSELFNPLDGSWSTPLNTMATARRLHTATLLPNGKVLVAGGGNSGSGAITSVEVYNPAAATWTAIDALNTGRSRHTATLLPTKLLVAGGTASNGSSLSSTELYDLTFYDIGAGLPGLFQGSAAWGDYDNDGRLDLLLTDSSLNPQVWRNTGGGFTNINAGLPGFQYPSAAWGDYDNDGRLDILVAGKDSLFDPDVYKVFRNTGSGFSNSHTGTLNFGERMPVAWGDFGNDGRLDILLNNLLYQNTGSGFTYYQALPGGAYTSVAWGDYDNDGRLDVLLDQDLYRNTGSGFSKILAGLPAVGFCSVAWGDYDNDGRLDILLTGAAGFSSTNQILSQVWRNTGSGFTNINAGLPGVFLGSAAWGDYDNDGRLDILLAGATDFVITNDTVYATNGIISQVWRNTGSGFTNINAGLPGVDFCSAAWGDYNNDGRLDILLTGTTNGRSAGGISQVWRNNTPLINTPPAAPTGLTAAAAGNTVTLSWNVAGDAQTPASGLTYNVRIGTTPGGFDVLAPTAGGNGFRRLPQSGNAQLGPTATFAYTLGTPYYWSVQAIDNSFAGSPFASEASFKLLQANPVLVPFSATNIVIGDLNGDGVLDESELSSVLTNYFASSPWLYLTNVAGLGGTNVTFALTNSLAGAFSVEYTTNLVDWYFLGPATSRYLFTDTNAPAVPQRSYRLRWP